MGTEIWCLCAVILVLVGVIVYQQHFFTRQIQTLVDKLMSRSFGEYQAVKNPPPPRAQIPTDVPDDLRGLQEFKLFG